MSIEEKDWPQEIVVSLDPPFADDRGAIQPLVDVDIKSCVLINSKKGSVRAIRGHVRGGLLGLGGRVVSEEAGVRRGEGEVNARTILATSFQVGELGTFAPAPASSRGLGATEPQS